MKLYKRAEQLADELDRIIADLGEIENIDDSILKKYNNENNLPIEFSKILKENI